LSKKDLKSFLALLKHWKFRLGLGEWVIYFDGFGDLVEDSYASCGWNLPGRVANVSLSRSWDYRPGEKDLSRVALHELLEIVLAPIVDMIPSNVHRDSVVDATHQVIRHIETMMFDNK
jgi:hypothetical protein